MRKLFSSTFLFGFLLTLISAFNEPNVTPGICPVISCSGDITTNTGPDDCGKAVTYSLQVTDNCGVAGSNIQVSSTAGLSVTVQSPGTSITHTAYFPIGTTTVTVTATDAAGNSSSCSFNVSVIDKIDPITSCKTVETQILILDNGCRAVVPDYTDLVTIWDNCPEGLTVEQVPAPGTIVYGTGDFTVGFSSTDASGNKEESKYACHLKIEKTDTTFPVIIFCAPPLVVNALPGQCNVVIPKSDLGIPSYDDNCDYKYISMDRIGVPANDIYPVGNTTITYTITDGSGNSRTCNQIVKVKDVEPPVVSNISVGPAILFPPNHKMQDVTVNYTSTDLCGPVTSCTLSVTSNEPVNGTGDGDTDPDWEIIDDHHVKLRAERSANGNGRIYTITITCGDAEGNLTTATTEVRVAHNITSPQSGKAFIMGSTINFSGEFWDKPGNKHTAKWLIDDNISVKGVVTEPTATKNGTVSGSYKFSAPGVYKLQMNITDQNGVTGYANTNGDLEAIVVVYDPNGGHTYGGGYFNSPAGALRSDPSVTGKASYGFAMNYFKNSTNPKGETQFEFKVGSFEFNALNFDYLVISNSMAQFKGTGKIVGGQSGIGFTMTVTDGQLDGTGVDKIRMKIYNKNNGSIIYDNQPGASDAALPTQVVGANSTVVISGTNSSLTSANTDQKAEMETKAPEVLNDLDVIAFPNPSTNNFTISVNAKTNERVTMQVVDMYGRIIETKNVTVNSLIRFGDRYIAGTYFVRVILGKQHKEIKLIKLSD
jgi:hypothetical protein